MQILGLFGVYFDAVVVEFKSVSKKPGQTIVLDVTRVFNVI